MSTSPVLESPPTTQYQDTQLYIDGRWLSSASGETIPVHNPYSGEIIGTVAHARTADLDSAVAASVRGFAVWRGKSAFERANTMRKAAALLRERSELIATLMTLEQGKGLAESLGEVERGAEAIDWMAGEAQRIYGRTIPARAGNVTQIIVKDPIGIVAAFTPWNFPINQLVRKVAGALAAGCAIIAKGPEETPASCAELIRAFADAGVPAGAMNLVYGTPSEISEYLIPRPEITKISFTGSTVVGKHLASLAGQHMKVATMELGGHAPVLIFADTDIKATARALVGNKFRCAGQSCISPTRFLIERSAFAEFVDATVKAASELTVGDGMNPATQVGPVATARRLSAIEAMVADAVADGATVRLGGKRIESAGYFYQPTVLTDVPVKAKIMNEEPFGPIILCNPFDTLEEAITESNRLPYGLAAFAFTASSTTANKIAANVRSGMVSINHFGLGMPETPFGGVGESGYGFEGGSEAIEAYLQTRFITKADL